MMRTAALLALTAALFTGCACDSSMLDGDLALATRGSHQTDEIDASRAREATEARQVRVWTDVHRWASVAIWRYATALRFATAYDAARRRAVAVETTAPQASAPRSSSPRATGSVDAHLMRIGTCESHLDPRAVSPSGKFRGAFQWSLPTWFAFGGGAFAADPIDASLDQQMIVARATYAGQGPGAWPVCQYR